ncbi:3-methyl-2-oxobutanoate hydroxymethyltransferase [Pelagibacteraceae bacterium]|nr:3-methyl-2-oxobutanoate hydroxymethyltransferase [Pelagibacteraceae bacterium]
MSKKIKFLNKIYNKPITCLTAYSGSVAKILDGNVDMILIGDSLGSTLYNMKNTQGVTLDMMKMHGKAVTTNVKKSTTIIDMPYKSYTTKLKALKNARELLNYSKANILKLEISEKSIPIINYLSKNKFNVIAHIGVTPQSYSDFKNIKVVGRKEFEKTKLLNLALDAEKAGAKAILLECVVENLSKMITSVLSIPTIGIGSSKFCDGQVLVFDDLVNINNNENLPKFVKKYMDLEQQIKKAVGKFSKEVKLRKFPSKKFTYQ